MNHSVKFSSFFFILIITAALNCTARDGKNNYKTDSVSGVKYVFFKQDKNGAKPVMGDIAFVRVVYKRDDDSLLFDSHAGGHTDSTSIIMLPLRPSFHGSLEQAITLMAAGDSACFLLNADSIYQKTFRLRELPPYIKSGSGLKFYVKLVRFETQSQRKDEEYATIEKHEAEMRKMQSAESDSIEKYIAKNKIKTKPTMVDSFYILERTGKVGRPVNDGDSVEIKYTGMLLNGTVFDQSDKGNGGKGTFTILYKPNAHLIRGWLEVLATMHEGEKIKVLLPSSMAYGPFGAGKDILPYTPLLFEIEVVKVSSPFDK